MLHFSFPKGACTVGSQSQVISSEAHSDNNTLREYTKCKTFTSVHGTKLDLKAIS